MTTIFKLTRPDLTTYQGFRYEPGTSYRFPGTGPFCGSGYSHAYLSPQLALLLNPIHGNYVPCRLWRASGIIAARDHDLKVGCSEITLDCEIPVPSVTLGQRITFALWCALAVHPEPSFVVWAENWLSGKNRSGAAAEAARAAEAGAARAAATARAAEAGAARKKPFDLVGIAQATLFPWEPTKAAPESA